MIGLKSLDKMPDFCQSCPCFTTYELKKPTYNVGVQYCNATKLPIKEALECSSVTQAWFHTERPKWCPLREDVQKVYIITRGCYSEYSICAVTDDETEAEKLRILNSTKWAKASIEEWPISPKVKDTKIHNTCWKFVISESGSILKDEKMSLVKESNSFELDDSFGMTAYVLEEDYTKALKIAFDQRAKMISERLGL